VSGNGIGFVWYDAVWRTSARRIGEAQDTEVVEGALAHEVEAGFIAVDEGDGGAAGETGQSIGQAAEAGSGGWAATVLGHSSSRATQRASSPWRREVRAERSFPCGVAGPRERCPLARDAQIRRREDMS
jgi:hypothetical protein